jgi:hypothetical protein
MTFLPLDPVIYKQPCNNKSYQGELIPAEVYYRTANRIAIKIKTPHGEVIKYVKEKQLTKRDI